MAPAMALSGVACTSVSRNDPGQRSTAVSDVTLNVAAGLLAPSMGTGRVFGQALDGINADAGARP